MQPIKSGENAAAKKLWHMPKADFNAWRQANDLPKLLSFFRSALPNFTEWQSTYQISDSEFIALPHTSGFFVGQKELHLSDGTSPGDNGKPVRALFIADLPAEAHMDRIKTQWGATTSFTVHASKPFLPYFYWLKRMKGMRLFPIPNDLNKGLTEDLRYMSWRGGDLADSRAALFHSHEVLKLGGVNITPQQLDDRNLDFVDLDGLELRGSGWARTTSVAYSSCRYMRLLETDKAFLTFLRCNLEDFRVIDSRLQDLHFIDCDLAAPVFRDSRLFLTSFRNSVPGGITFENCDIQELHFLDNPKRMSFSALSDFFKRLRFAFQQRGNRREASHYYYVERVYELLGQLAPFIPQGGGLPQRAYVGSYADLIERSRLGQIDGMTMKKLLLGNLVFYAKVFLLPQNLFRLALIKKKLLADACDWAVWGFGERPARVFPWMIAVLVGFAGKYYFVGREEVRGRWWDSFFCSAFNFSTMGCDYKTSFDSLEGILGATLLAILVAGFGNRTRY